MMKPQHLDRITEILAALCVAAAVSLLVLPAGSGDAGRDLAGMRAREIQGTEAEAFRASLDETRRLVDGGGDAGGALDGLADSFPARHEVWALSARYLESTGDDDEALMGYARAVRLEPDYLDKGSPLYLGARIEGVTGRVLSRLREKRAEEGLTGDEAERLRAAYFLVRRLAGGCE